MDVSAAVRNSLFDSVSNVEPGPFRQELESILTDASVTPGVITMRTADVIDRQVDEEELQRRAAGVVISYEGLRLTRELVREDPWAASPDNTAENLDLLASEVLVARGLYRLAPTGVAYDAVQIARRFGRNQTNEQLPDTEPDEPTLEYDTIRLAVQTGADYALTEVPDSIMNHAGTVAGQLDAEPLPDPEDATAGFDEEFEAVLRKTALPTGSD